MAKQRQSKHKTPIQTQRDISPTELNAPLADNSKANKKLEWLIALVLLAVGIFQSIIYFDHKVVPNLDFPAFYSSGEALWSGTLPSNLKRAPVLGFMQVGLSHFVGGQTPGLTAGRIINAIFHPLCILLLWGIGKRLIGSAAIWVTLLALMNPWVIWLIPEPIAQPPMLFFMLAGFYLALKGSRWAYLFGALACMTRYDGGAILLAIGLYDLLTRKTTKEKLMTFVWGLIGFLPLMIWMLLTYLKWDDQGGEHYLKVMTGGDKGLWVAFTHNLKQAWDVAFSPLIYSPKDPTNASKLWILICQIIVGTSFFLSFIWACIKRNWIIVSLFVFLIPYFCVHAMMSFNYHKFHSASHWAILLICAYGIYTSWLFLNNKLSIPKWFTLTCQSLIGLGAILLIVYLAKQIPTISKLSQNSTLLTGVGLSAVVVICIARLIITKKEFLIRDLSGALIVAAMILSNQFVLVNIVGSGQRDIEFKLLADWYVKNAQSGEKLATTMPHIVRIFAPKASDEFSHTRFIRGKDINEFTQSCYKKNITYVAWDSRMGYYPQDIYYKRYGLQKIAPLYRPQDLGPYKYLTTMGTKFRHIHVFRLQDLASFQKEK